MFIQQFLITVNDLQIPENYMKNTQVLKSSINGVSTLLSNVARMHRNAKFVSDIKGEPIQQIKEDIKAVNDQLKNMRIYLFRLRHIAKAFERQVELAHLHDIENSIQDIEERLNCLNTHLPN